MKYIQCNDNDILGDSWSRAMSAIWDEMKNRDPDLCSVPGTYAVWQWTHCVAAEMPHRVVASPEAMAICGESIPSADHVEKVKDLCDQVITDIIKPPPPKKEIKLVKRGSARTVKIKFDGSTEEVEVKFSDPEDILGVYKHRESKGYVITHIPTGCALNRPYKYLRDAKAIVSAIAANALPEAARSENVSAAADALKQPFRNAVEIVEPQKA